MKYLSVCSGIEAATVAWHPLGWKPWAFAEIDKFPCAVLAHHYPNVPNLGDMSKFEEWPDATLDVLVGGTPCQSFSVAGLRKGLADARGNLSLTFLGIADRYRPEWLIWENVPGVLSQDGGRAFGSILGGMAELGYHGSYRVLDAQFVRVDGFGRAVPQRRRRVFVVANLRDWRRAAAVLFETESLCWNSAPRREAGQRIAGAISASSGRRGGVDEGERGGLIAGTLNASGKAAGSATQQDAESGMLVAHALRAEGFDASEDGTGRGTPLIPVAFDTTQITSKTNRCNPQPGDACHPLAAGAHAPAIAFDARQSDVIQYGDMTGPLDTDGHTIAVCHAIQAGALRENPDSGPDGVGVQANAAYTLEARAEVRAVQGGGAVRRLTPRECERLQGFPDDYTLISVRGKPAADGPRYKALGNSMAVNVMRWLGRRIETISEISSVRLDAAE